MINGILVCCYWLITFADSILVISAAFREAKKNGKKLPALSEKKLRLEWVFLALRGGIIVFQLILGLIVEKAAFRDILFVVIGAELLGHGSGAAFLLCDFLLLYLTRVSRAANQKETHNENSPTCLRRFGGLP